MGSKQPEGETMEREKVYLVVTILNGYKNFEQVFRKHDDAVFYARRLSKKWGYERHEINVIEMLLR